MRSSSDVLSDSVKEMVLARKENLFVKTVHFSFHLCVSFLNKLLIHASCRNWLEKLVSDD